VKKWMKGILIGLAVALGLVVLFYLFYATLMLWDDWNLEPVREETAVRTTERVTEAITEPEEEEIPNIAMPPSYALTDTHFYAIEWDNGEANSLGLYCAALDNLSHVKRIPLPVHYEGVWLCGGRIDKIDNRWIYLTAQVGFYFNRDDAVSYVQLRVDPVTYACELLGTSATLPDAELPPQAEPPMDIDDFCYTYYSAYDYRQALPRPDYEITSCYAKTPTHIFAARENELYRMPLNDIAQQEKISLPGKADQVIVCGLTEEWLFVCAGQTVVDEEYSSYPYLQSAATYKVSLETMEAEKIDESKTEEYPRYNAESNSHLYIRGHTVEALNLDTGKRGVVFDFNDYYLAGSDNSRISGWFNTLGGVVALQIHTGWWGGYYTCLLFGENNEVRIADIQELPKLEQPPEPKPSKAEQALGKRDDIWTYVTCGDYIYYVELQEKTEDYQYARDLYRMKLDGTSKKLLRAKTNIFRLMEVNGKLLCMANLPDNRDSEEFGFYALDEDGKVAKTIAHGWDGEWGWHIYERFGDLAMFSHQSANGSEDSLVALYDPATGAFFKAE